MNIFSEYIENYVGNFSEEYHDAIDNQWDNGLKIWWKYNYRENIEFLEKQIFGWWYPKPT